MVLEQPLEHLMPLRPPGMLKNPLAGFWFGMSPPPEMLNQIILIDIGRIIGRKCVQKFRRIVVESQSCWIKAFFFCPSPE